MQKPLWPNDAEDGREEGRDLLVTHSQTFAAGRCGPATASDCQSAGLRSMRTSPAACVWKEMQLMAVFRAVENRVSIVMVDGAFRTTMVDPYGRMVADQVTPAGGPLTLVADVPMGNPNDLYTKFGDWVGWFCLLAWIGSMVYQSADERRRKKAERAVAGSN